MDPNNVRFHTSNLANTVQIKQQVMEIQNDEHATKLLRSQGNIWNHIFSFINSMCLKCVVELGIADIIHNYGKPMPLSQLIAALAIQSSKAGNINRLMRVMVHSGFFSRHNVTENELEMEYSLTDDSILLLKDHPFSVTPFLQFELEPVSTKTWHHMSNWFKSDDLNTFETAHGMLPWDYAKRDPNFSNSFHESMASDARLITSVFMEKCKSMLNGFESLVDVGGGTGTLAKAIAESFPHLKCTVLDLPRIVAGLQGSENLKYVGGDMFKEIPPADAIILKWILHDWSDEDCLKILKKCKEAIKSTDKEGKVIIIDMVMGEEKGDHKSVETQLYFDMLMMVVLTGKERNKKEWAKLITSAGFSDYKITPVLGLTD